jgi:hypothetical protein
MHSSELLALYDRHERQEAREPGMRREALEDVVRLIDLRGTESAIVYSRLSPETADAAILREAGYFEGLGHTLEWKLFAHDAPADLRDRLLAQGFKAEDEETILALDLSKAPDALLRPVSADIRRITRPEDLKDVTAVRQSVWPGRHAWLEERLAGLLTSDPRSLSIYVAYVDGVPASSARIQFSDHSPFAGLWGGATVEELRGRGLYSGLLAVRVQEAIQRGVRFLTIDATPMSRPIVEKFGFQRLTAATAHVLPAAVAED